MAKYTHGKTEYSRKPSGLSFQHRTDPDNPLPEHGSHSQSPPSQEVVMQGRQALLKGAGAIADWARTHGLSDAAVKAHIDDNFSSPKYRQKTFSDYLANKGKP